MNVLTRLRALKLRYKLALALILILAGLTGYARWDSTRGLETPLTDEFAQKAPGHAKELIVFAHGFAKGIKPLLPVIEAVRKAHPDADVLFFSFSGHVFSNASTFGIAAQMDDRLNQLAGDGQYDRIHLVGYSSGALLLRKAYVYGRGHLEDHPLSTDAHEAKRQPQGWVRHVDRIVLLAGMNRGWTQDDPTITAPLWKKALNAFGVFIGKISGSGKFILSLRRGEPFVANLRLQWLDTFNRSGDAVPDIPQPTVIQLLGKNDDVVSQDDNRDVIVAKDFIWVGVSETDHASILDLEQPVYGAERRTKILQALGNEAEVEELKRKNAVPDSREDPAVTTVVFVLHGIRDMGEWTSQFEEPMQERFRALHAGTSDKLILHRPGYGYFPMGPFLLWSDRQRNVRWFMDEVTELKAKYPNLKQLHVIAHSNGTYVVASALRNYRTLKVGNLALAGSVLPSGFEWKKYESRVTNIRNYVGADDLVVGIFPHLFEVDGFHWINPDLGGAGFNGFNENFGKALETKFLKGGHAAALQAENIPGIVSFILQGERVDPDALVVGAQEGGASMLSKLCWLVWIALVGIIVGLGFLVAYVARWVYRRKTPRRFSQGAVSGIVGVSYALFVLMLLNTV